MNKKIKKAIFPVGGLGTRFLPVTKSMPKEMLPVLNKPLIHHAFDEAKQAGIEQFIFIIGRNKNSIIDHFDHAVEIESLLGIRDNKEMLSLAKDFLIEPGNIIFIRQQEPLGLGHAVWCARNVVGNEPFAVILADDFFIDGESIGIMQKMVKNFNVKEDYNLIAVKEVPISESKKYGMIATDCGTLIKDMIEKPDISDAPSNLAIVGRYILSPLIFSYLEKTERDINGEIQLTNAIKKMLSSVVSKAYHVDAYRLDCGEYIGYLEANLRLALQNEQFADHLRSMLSNVLS